MIKYLGKKITPDKLSRTLFWEQSLILLNRWKCLTAIDLEYVTEKEKILIQEQMYKRFNQISKLLGKF